MGKPEKRKRGEAAGSDDDCEPSTSGQAGGTVGQQTSFIKNKLVRSEMYAKLKGKDKVGVLAFRTCVRVFACVLCVCVCVCVHACVCVCVYVCV